MPSTLTLLAGVLCFWKVGEARTSHVANLLRRAPPTKPGFSFSFEEAPTQCSLWNFKIDGGKPPFSVTLIATEPNSKGHFIKLSFGIDGKAPYSASVPFAQPQGIEVVAVMSDAEGFGTGGVTAPMRVQNSSDSNCVPSASPDDKTFWWMTTPYFPGPTDGVTLATTISQCEEVTLSWDDPENAHAKPPFDVFGVVPGGQSWVIANGTSARNVTTVVNLAPDETFIWLVFGNDQQQYGGNMMYKVQGGNSSCMSSDSPTATANPISAIGGTSSSASTTASLIASTTSAHDDHGGTGNGNSNVAKTVGPIVGVVGAAIIAAIFFVWWWKKRRNNKGAVETGGMDLVETKDDLRDPHQVHHPALPITPFTGPAHNAASPSSPYGYDGSNQHGNLEHSPSTEKGFPLGPSNGSNHHTPMSSSHPHSAPSRTAPSPLRIEHEEDAGSFPMPQERVEKLPPTYNPNWLASRPDDVSSSAGLSSPDGSFPSHKREILQEKHRYGN